ncbi:hypothetical protein [Streptomyces sp. 7N604]|uniref:hypothetical protein n=1 Tax=Streptomyces sp. 7N604 TaxID=3457415 RepID=UPI003FD67D35
MKATTALRRTDAGDVHADGTYEVPGRYTAVRVTLRTGIHALDRVRSAGHRLGPVQVCHTHRVIHILVDADQAAAFTDVPGVLAAADDNASCGHHWSGAPYWIVPPGRGLDRIDANVLRTLLTAPQAAETSTPEHRAAPIPRVDLANPAGQAVEVRCGR